MAYFIFQNIFPQNALLFSALVGVLYFIVFLSLWSNQIKWFIAIIATLLFYIFSFYFIFSIDYYSKFLRIVGYGGGSLVKIGYKESDIKHTSDDCYLLLRTSNSLICLDEDKITVTEIPIVTVKKIQYVLGGQNHNFINVYQLVNKNLDEKTIHP